MNRPSSISLVATVLTLGLFLSACLGADDRPPLIVTHLDGEVDIGRTALIEKAADAAIASKAAAFLIEIDSPGGRIDYMEDMLRAVERVRASGILTIAWVRGNAWSAAAVLATACDRLYMNRSASIGAAQPIFMTGEGVKTAGEKFVSAMRTEARAQAERTGRPAVLAEAMVDPDIEVLLVWVDGETKVVSGQEWKDILEKSYRDGFEARLEKTLLEKGKLLSLTVKQAVDLKYADGTAGTRAEILDLEDLAAVPLREVNLTWSHALANFLTLPMVSSLLFLLGIAGLYIEVKSPGIGLPGALGVVFLATFFFAKYTTGLAEAHEILIFAAGAVLLAVEIFVIPGFGVPGVLGILMMVLGLFLSSQHFLLPETPGQWSDFRLNILFTGITLIATVGVAILLGAYLPRSPWVKRMALDAPLLRGPQTGSAAPSPLEVNVGSSGRAETDLRPAGKALVADRLIDVVTEGDYIERGDDVNVVAIEGNRVVVAAVERPFLDEEDERA